MPDFLCPRTLYAYRSEQDSSSCQRILDRINIVEENVHDDCQISLATNLSGKTDFNSFFPTFRPRCMTSATFFSQQLSWSVRKGRQNPLSDQYRFPLDGQFFLSTITSCERLLYVQSSTSFRTLFFQYPRSFHRSYFLPSNTNLHPIP